MIGCLSLLGDYVVTSIEIKRDAFRVVTDDRATHMINMSAVIDHVNQQIEEEITQARATTKAVVNAL